MQKIFNIIFLFCISTTVFGDDLIIEPDNGRAPILEAIQNAKTSIDLIMYGLTDPQLIRALINAKNQGKKVTVLLEPAPYESEHENAFATTLLKNANIPIEKPNPAFQLTHQKTIVIDNNKAYLLTFNFTQSTFTHERNFGVTTTNTEDVQEIENVMHADANHTLTNPTQQDLVWSPNNSRQKIIAFIQSAKSNLKIYAQDISDFQLIGELAKASKRGIRVEILTSNAPNAKNQNKYNYLTHAGVKFYFSKKYYIHAKVIIVDNERALLGSINLTKPSIDNNRELAIILTNKEIIQTLNQKYAEDQH